MSDTAAIQLPLLPLRDVVVYPHMVLPLFVGRERSIEALEHAMSGNKQSPAGGSAPRSRRRPRASTTCIKWALSPPYLQLLKLPDGTIKVLVEGSERRRSEAIDTARLFSGNCAGGESARSLKVPMPTASAREIVDQFEKYVKREQKGTHEVLTSLSGIEEPGRLADTIAAHMAVDLREAKRF